MRLNPFMRCACGKIHLRTGVTRTSVCPRCGRDLYSLAFFDQQTSPQPSKQVSKQVEN